MKYQFRLKGKPEDVFDYNFADVENKYFEAKNKHIKDLGNKKITFQIEKASAKKKKTNIVSYATIKVTRYEYPKNFSFEYKSDTYQKFTEYDLIYYDEQKNSSTFTVYIHDTYTRSGVTKVRNSDSRDLHRTPLTLKLEFDRSFKNYMKNKS